MQFIPSEQMDARFHEDVAVKVVLALWDQHLTNREESKMYFTRIQQLYE